MISNLVLLLSLQVLVGPQAPQVSSPACPPGIVDQSQPGNCINAASTPTPGMLLPLGPYFWVGNGGDVGIGTQQPQAQLHVAGDVVAEGRLALGSEAVLGGSGAFSYEADMGFYVDQFPGTFSIGLHSEVQYDPPIDLTGPDTGWLWAHMFETSTVPSNDRDMDALFRGTGELVNGKMEIPVPEDFAIVTEEAGLTVQVTALGDARLWVERKGLNRILVRGTADVEFDYLVNGVRAGYAEFETIRQKPLENVSLQPGRPEYFPTLLPENN